ncbi:hypothetical protein [Proteus vulgaris]|nr:hypothetical protein IM703_16165 [Proteus vulgaris]
MAAFHNVNCHPKVALRVGDTTTICPKCKQVGTVITGESRVNKL